ncbi:MAG: hypothetical protein A2Z07_04305 [Armatimonadetes bacterium RBG_16_67_12]|nr:MAG: hypothetical protein A2Z07_04305 [Armatimonadetes bacterium RBG_16_67_12]
MTDVLGRDLEHARRVLEAEGFQVEVVETRSPRRVEMSGPLRVVRQRQTGEYSVQLAATHERYVPAPRAPRA